MLKMSLLKVNISLSTDKLQEPEERKNRLFFLIMWSRKKDDFLDFGFSQCSRFTSQGNRGKKTGKIEQTLVREQAPAEGEKTGERS